MFIQYRPIYFIIFLMVHFTSARAEFIFLEESADGSISQLSDPETYSLIDPLRMTYQFPMIMNPLFQDQLKEMSTKEKELIEGPEDLFLQEILNKKISLSSGKKIKVIYVPTVIYELYTVGSLFHDLDQSLLDASKKNLKRLYRQESINPSGDRLSKEDVGKSHHNSNLKQINLRESINQGLTEMLLQSLSKEKINNDIAWQDLFHQLIILRSLSFKHREIKDINWSSILLSTREEPIDRRFKESFFLTSTILNLVEDEIKMFKQGKFSLYRGHKDLLEDFTRPPRHSPPSYLVAWSLSYGMSLFAGLNQTERSASHGACAWSYAANKDYYGRRLGVSRSMAINGEVPFYLPFLDTITSLFSSGEFFHARTIFGKEVNKDYRCKGITCNITNPMVELFIQSQEKNTQELYKNFLEQDSFIFKPKMDKDKGKADDPTKIYDDVSSHL
jgi:hypothetical protein